MQYTHMQYTQAHAHPDTRNVHIHTHMRRKKAHYTAYFEKNKSSEIWKGLRSLINIKTSKMSQIKLLDVNNNILVILKIFKHLIIILPQLRTSASGKSTLFNPNITPI